MLERLRNEWLVAERAQKLHEVARLAKTGGIIAAKSLFAFAVIAGTLSIAAIAPNVFAAYGKLTGGASRRFYAKRILEAELKGLQKRGFVHVKRTSDSYRIKATERGTTYMLRRTAAYLAINQSGTWDGTWWLVAFDIPRRHNAERNALRERLKQIGMERLQASVFISRYPCAEEVWFTARHFGMENYITIAHVDEIEGYGRAFTRAIDG